MTLLVNDSPKTDMYGEIVLWNQQTTAPQNRNDTHVFHKLLHTWRNDDASIT